MKHTTWSNETLKSFGPCEDGYEWYVKNCLEKGIDNTAQIVRMLIADGELEWANWTIARALDRKGRLKYAINAARSVLHIFEAKHPIDNRPRLAIEAAERVLDDDTPENRAAAWSAWSAWAALSAWAATWDAGKDVAWAAWRIAGDALLKELIEFGIKLLEEES